MSRSVDVALLLLLRLLLISQTDADITPHEGLQRFKLVNVSIFCVLWRAQKCAATGQVLSIRRRRTTIRPQVVTHRW